MLYNTPNPHGGDIPHIQWDFSANVNPLGTPQGVLDAVKESLSALSAYPDPYCRKLVRALSEAEKVPESFILCGNGAAELIYAFCRALQVPLGAEPVPTFCEYSLAMEAAGGSMLNYRLSPDRCFSLDGEFLSFLKENRPSAVFLCNPNNPTGMLLEQNFLEEILGFCHEHHIRLLVDECFLELCQGGRSLVPLLSEFPELTILKAFTKTYGMAGLRLGYCLSSDSKFLEAVARQLQPWNVSIPAQAAGVAALQERDYVQVSRRLIYRQRQYLMDRLQEAGLRPFAGCANFILFKGPVGLEQKLLEKKIGIRCCRNFPGLGEGWYRIAVRTEEENRVLVQAVKASMEELS